MRKGLWVLIALIAAGCGGDEAKPKTLAEICERHPSDKCAWGHDYIELYDRLFAPLRGKASRILEIGVARGHSLRLWEEYFPAAKILGLDIHPKTEFDSSRVATMVADQGKRGDLQAALQRLGRDLDLVIDDGGHRMDQQQISFAVLFPALKPGGLYIIEDVHTSFPQLYPGYGVEPDGSNSTYTMIDHFVRTGEIRSKYMSAEESKYLGSNIAYCAYFFRPTRKHSDLLFCGKK